MADAHPTPEERLQLKSIGGNDVDFERDADGDLYIGLTSKHDTECFYVPADRVKDLKDWINRVFP